MYVGRLDPDRYAPESLDADENKVGGADDANLWEVQIDAVVGVEEACVFFRLDDVIFVPEGTPTTLILPSTVVVGRHHRAGGDEVDG